MIEDGRLRALRRLGLEYGLTARELEIVAWRAAGLEMDAFLEHAGIAKTTAE